jgi:hypothetical protein
MNERMVLPCQGDVDDGHDGYSQGDKIMRSTVPDLPEVRWHKALTVRTASIISPSVIQYSSCNNSQYEIYILYYL